ncbi:unannotated protein [freshwater metagenome]|uniref:Unannotated protein n=1 Tax=freshwater metagenome TaxID=449393 RepID=A0A6J6I0I0_9ZZZZ
MKFRLGRCGGHSLEQRHLQVHATTRSKDPPDFTQGQRRIGDMFKHVRREKNVDGVVGETDRHEVDLDIGDMVGLVEITGRVLEPLPHHPAVVATHSRTCLEHPKTPRFRIAREEPVEKESVPGDAAALRTCGHLDMKRFGEFGSAPTADVARGRTVAGAGAGADADGCRLRLRALLPPDRFALGESDSTRQRPQTCLDPLQQRVKERRHDFLLPERTRRQGVPIIAIRRS